MQKLSLVIPCYNEESCIKLFYNAIKSLRLDLTVEFVFVDDGSSDNTIGILRELSKLDDSVRFISFSRNFGKEAALLAGLKYATGNFIATMDADLQDPPALLPDMLSAIINEGYDCVATRRSTRKGEPILRSLFARFFYWLMAHFSDVSMVDGARDYRLMTRQVVDVICSLTETNRFTKGIYQWIGFKTKWLSFENIERTAGKTKFSFFKLCRYSIEGITSFSTVPLHLTSCCGIICCLLSFLYIIYVVAKTLIFGEIVKGYPSLVCLLLFISGLQMLFLGTIGTYIAKIYKETKHRPIYIIKDMK